MSGTSGAAPATLAALLRDRLAGAAAAGTQHAAVPQPPTAAPPVSAHAIQTTAGPPHLSGIPVLGAAYPSARPPVNAHTHAGGAAPASAAAPVSNVHAGVASAAALNGGSAPSTNGSSAAASAAIAAPADQVIPGVPPGQLMITYEGRQYYVCPQAMHAKVPSHRPPWHADEHKLSRRSLINEINRILQNKPFFSSRPEDINNNSLTFERGMYYGARSLEEYLDPATLETRLLLLVPFKRTIDEYQRGKQQQVLAMRAMPGAAPAPAVLPAPGVPSVPPARGFPALPVNGVSGGPSAFQAPSSIAVALPTSGAPATSVPAARKLAEAIMQRTDGARALDPATVSAPAAQAGSVASMNDANLRRQQTARLIMLHHASKCTAPVCQTKDCAALKATLAHLKNCKDDEHCAVKHCMSSRYCVKHYRSCKDATCDICVPVRHFINSNYGGADAPATSAPSQLASAAAAGVKRAYEGAASDAPLDLKRARMLELQALRPQALTREQFDALPAEAKAEYMAAHKRYTDAYQRAQAEFGAAMTGQAQPRRKSGRVDGDCTLIATFTREQIRRHMVMLQDEFSPFNHPDQVATDVGHLLHRLMNLEFSWIFNSPVDPVALNLPDYFDIVKKPMDLGTVKKRLDARVYRSLKSFGDDVRLVWRNALTYNPAGTEVHDVAYKMSNFFEGEWDKINAMARQRFLETSSHDNNCSLCGCGVHMFEPPTLYCNKCTQRIKKDAVYHQTRSNKYHLCATCFGDVKRAGNGDIQIDGQVLPASDFQRRKNSSHDDEAFVQCDHCQRWQHVICTLHNQRRDAGSEIPHYCPQCIHGHMQAKETDAPIAKPVRGAADLPRSRLSDFIEERLQIMLESQRDVLAIEQEVDRAAVLMPQFSVRMVSCVDKVLLVNKEMFERYKAFKYPSQFNYRSKALMLWQKLGGVDVFLYGIYVQEYGDDCPEPNRRTAYLSYLDSVKYLQPSCLRTEVYHEILIAYMEDLKMRGFNQLTLWSCPPLRNDDYILYCHPEEQRTPRPDRLREWYLRMAETAQRRGIVEKVVFLLDDYFPSFIGSEGGGDRMLTQLPWCQGDYWPGLVPDYISTLAQEAGAKTGVAVAPPVGDPPSGPVLETLGGGTASAADTPVPSGPAAPAGEDCDDDAEDGADGGGDAAPGAARDTELEMIVAPGKEAPGARAGKDKRGRGRGKSKARGRAPAGRATTTSTAAAANAAQTRRVPVGVDGRPLPQDALRDKIYEQLARMPKDFIVVKLRPSCQFCKRYITGAPGMDRKFHCLACEKMEAAPLYNAPKAKKGTATSGMDPLSKRPGVAYDLCPDCFDRERRAQESGTRGLLQHAHGCNVFVPVPVELAPGLRRHSHDTAPAAPQVPPAQATSTNSTSAAASPSTVTAPGMHAPAVPESLPPVSAPAAAVDAADAGALVMTDPDPIITSPFFEYRENLLHLCQGNHYQFDQLRRAMHSSMMILWHMHHPAAPSFVHSCNSCMMAITQGHRYTCTTCPEEFDLCEKCYEAARGTPKAHPHDMQRHPVTGLGDEDAALAKQKLQEQAEASLRLLEHTCSSCLPAGTARCGRDDCSRMVLLLTHYRGCQAPRATCESCSKAVQLIRRHAARCRFSAGECRVPDCELYKEQLRQANATAVSLDLRRRAATSAAKTGVRSDGARMTDDAPADGDAAASESTPAASAAAAASAEAPGVSKPAQASTPTPTAATGDAARLVASKGARSTADALGRGDTSAAGSSGSTSRQITEAEMAKFEQRQRDHVARIGQDPAQAHHYEKIRATVVERYYATLSERARAHGQELPPREAWTPNRVDNIRITSVACTEFDKYMAELRRRTQELVAQEAMNTAGAQRPTEATAGPSASGHSNGASAPAAPPAALNAIGNAEDESAAPGGGDARAPPAAARDTSVLEQDAAEDPFAGVAAAPSGDADAQHAFAGTPIEDA